MEIIRWTPKPRKGNEELAFHKQVAAAAAAAAVSLGDVVMSGMETAVGAVADTPVGMIVQPGALVIGRHYITEPDSAPVQYNGVV